MSELSVQDIIEKKTEAIKCVENHLPSVSYDIFYKVLDADTRTSVERNFASKKQSQIEDIVSEFKNDIDGVLRMKPLVAVRIVVFSGNKRKQHAEFIWQLMTPERRYVEDVSYAAIHNNTQEEPEEHPQQPLVNQPPQQQFGIPTNAMTGVLQLMGFNTKGLNGPEEDNNTFAGLGMIMGVRDQNMRNEYERKDIEKKNQELQIEKAKLEAKISELQKEITSDDTYIEELETKIEELNEQISGLEKLKPEYSIAGVSLVGVLSKAAENLLKRHSDLVGSLAGVDGEYIRKALEKPEEIPAQQQQQTATPAADVEIAPVSKHAAEITAINQILDKLTDTEFEQVAQLFVAISQHREIIAQIPNFIEEQTEQ